MKRKFKRLGCKVTLQTTAYDDWWYDQPILHSNGSMIRDETADEFVLYDHDGKRIPIKKVGFRKDGR